jgi:hypothetical protein
MRASAPRAGFTAGELVTALFIIFVGTLFVARAGQAGFEAARTASCLSNVRQLVLAMRTYASDTGGLMPPGPQAFGPLDAYTRSTQIYACPGDEKPKTIRLFMSTGGGRMAEQEVQVSYLMNPTARLDDLPATMLVGDDRPARHVGHRWIGARLDGAAYLWPADQWQTRLGWVMSDAQAKSK